MTHIWLITTAYGEGADSHTIRLDHMLNNVDRSDFRITLVTPSCPASERYKGSIRRVDDILFTDAPLLVRLIGFSSHFPLIGRRLAWILNNLFYRFAIPDKFRGWNEIVLKAFEECADRPDLILSASGSCEAHIAGCRIKTAYGIPWIADFGDPWHFIELAFRPILAERVKRLEKATLARCDSIIVTTDSTKAMYEHWLGRSTSVRVRTIPYGFIHEDIEHVIRDGGLEEVDYFCHVGTAHTADRNLIPLIRAVAQYQKEPGSRMTGLILAGRRSPSFDEEVKRLGLDNAQLFQAVSYRESLRLQCMSRVIVIVGNKSGAQIPGKVYVALGVKKPILYIRQCEACDDEALTVLRTYSDPVVCENSEASIYNALGKVLERRREIWGRQPVYDEAVHPIESMTLAREIESEINLALQTQLDTDASGGQIGAG